MPMNTLRTALLALVVAAAFRAAAQPVYTFRVKVGIDRESVDSLGGRDRVVQLTEDMFRRVNRAFNYGAQLRAVYDFVVDWDAFYIYDGVSADQIRKPHPDHDYLVVMDGYKSDPRETGGGWYGDGIQAIYHSRTHNDRFNSPFEKNAIDGIIHEFGHARGVPDIYAMKVDADKNPVNGQAFFRRAVHHELSLWRGALERLCRPHDRTMPPTAMSTSTTWWRACCPTVSGSRWRMPTQARPKGLSCGSIPCGGTPIR